MKQFKRRIIPKDLTGMKFGRLTAIRLDGMEGEEYYWICKCECGGELRTTRKNLVGGGTRSCGCLWRESAIRNAAHAWEANRKKKD